MPEKEELFRRLAQARRLLAQPVDPVTKERVKALVVELEAHLAGIEAKDSDPQYE